MEKIKAIFFDWGYTFVKGFEAGDQQLNDILRPFGFNWEEFKPIWRDFYNLRSAGRIKTDKELEIIIQRVTQKSIPVNKIIDITVETQLIPKEHIDIVKKLKKDHKVALLSNNVQEWVDRGLINYGIENLFDDAIVSSAAGFRKPDALIYFEALKRLSVKPAESIFIADELSEDLVAASGLGMKTVWLKTKEIGWWRENDERVLEFYKPDAVIEYLKEIIPIIKKYDK